MQWKKIKIIIIPLVLLIYFVISSFLILLFGLFYGVAIILIGSLLSKLLFIILEPILVKKSEQDVQLTWSEKAKLFLIGCFLVGIILIIGSVLLITPHLRFGKPLEPGDFDFENLTYMKDIHYSDIENKIIVRGSFIINNFRDDDFGRAVVCSDHYCSKQKLERGNNTVLLYMLFDSINHTPEIEVCFVLGDLWLPEEEHFLKNDSTYTKFRSGDTICKTKIFDSLKVDINITPEPLLITMNRSQDGDSLGKIVVKNTGDATMDFLIYIPRYFPKCQEDYPKDYPRGRDYMGPSNSSEYTLFFSPFTTPCTLGESSNEKAPVGNYNITAYVYVPGKRTDSECECKSSRDRPSGYRIEDAIFKKSFTIIINVVE